MGQGASQAAPPPPPDSLLVSCFKTVPWDLFGQIMAVQAALTLVFWLIVGNRRNKAAVMGGADSDGSKTTAAVKQGSPLAAVLAYNIVAILYAGFASYTGTTAWFDGTAALVGTTLHDRFYAYSAPYASIARATIAYELYNTAAVLLIHEYRNLPSSSHSTCLVLGIMSTHPFCHYYATFFFGLTAISSIPLSAIELFQAAELPGPTEACRAIFCVVFIIFRTLYWPIESYKYWADALAALNGDIPVHNAAAHYFLLFANVGLTLLQWYWTSLIFNGIAEKLRGGAAAADAKKK